MTNVFESIKKVLFVDDDANIRLIVQMSLEGTTQWQILLAESGEEALKIAQQEEPDLILLDVMMPDMDGLEVFESLKKACTKSIPVIFITAKVQRQEIKGYKAAGASGVIIKPFNALKLAQEVRYLLQENQQSQAVSSLEVPRENSN